MFKKKLVFEVAEMEAINVCRIIGKYGLRFEISKLHSIVRPDDDSRKLYYRVFTVYATKRQAYELYEELNIQMGNYI